MALVKCKECGEQISTKADACPKCGAKRPKKTSGCAWLVAIAFGFVVYIAVTGVSDYTPTTSTRTQQPPAEPLIIVESSQCTTSPSGEYAQLKGRVRNNSDSNLRGVTIVGAFFTQDDREIGTADGIIDINPLLPGQTSGFTVWGPQNPEYAKCRIDAVTSGFRQISWKRESS